MLILVPQCALHHQVDLIPKENATRWLKYLRQYFPTLPFKASGGRGELGRSFASDADKGGGEGYGGEQLLQLLKNYSRSMNMKTAITVADHEDDHNNLVLIHFLDIVLLSFEICIIDTDE